MKTATEWFQELPDGIRELALANLVDDIESEDMETAIGSAFYWDETKEGFDFWGKVCRAAGDGEYPKIPRITKTPEGVLDGSKTHFPQRDEEVSMGLAFEKPKDPIVESVIQSFRARSSRGIEKYGTTLADNTAKLEEWITHAQQEAMDFCLYLERIKQDVAHESVPHEQKVIEGEIKAGTTPKIFTEEDMRRSFEAGNKRGWSGYPNTDNWTQPNFEDFIQTLKQSKLSDNNPIN